MFLWEMNLTEECQTHAHAAENVQKERRDGLKGRVFVSQQC